MRSDGRASIAPPGPPGSPVRTASGFPAAATVQVMAPPGARRGPVAFGDVLVPGIDAAEAGVPCDPPAGIPANAAVAHLRQPPAHRLQGAPMLTALVASQAACGATKSPGSGPGSPARWLPGVPTAGQAAGAPRPGRSSPHGWHKRRGTRRHDAAGARWCPLVPAGARWCPLADGPVELPLHVADEHHRDQRPDDADEGAEGHARERHREPGDCPCPAEAAMVTACSADGFRVRVSPARRCAALQRSWSWCGAPTGTAGPVPASRP